MNFFKTLSETGIKDVIIQVKQDSTGSITVFLTPKTIAEDSALKGLKPLHLTGTPEEIDAEFFGLVTTPLVQTQTVFNNVEAFEAQLKEASKATADKKASKKATADKQSEEETTEEKVPVVKEPKVNNEKVLKDFITSIKGENILSHKEKIEELCSNLSETELGKPFAKKVKLDLEIAIRKEEVLQAAREKHGFAPKKEEAPVQQEITEMVSDTPEFIEEKTTDAPTLLKQAVMEVVKESPNVQQEESAGPEEGSAVDAYEKAKEVAVPVAQSSAPIVETSVPAPLPPAPIVPQFKEVKTIKMIVDNGTYEDYIKAGWNDDLLIEHGKAIYETTMVEIEQAPSIPAGKLSYTFPKAFDAEEEE